MTTQVLDKIKEFECAGEFNRHLSPANWDEAKPVDENFPYIPNRLLKLKYALINFFVVKPLRWYQRRIVFKVKIVGRENIKGIKSAIITSNHIAIFDGLAHSYAFKRHKLKIIGAEFNNKKGWFGESMRAHGLLPLSAKYQVLKKFSNAVEHHLLHDSYILIYPEESLWNMYEKPRPFKNGAFNYAARFFVPVIPVFITFRSSGKFNKDKTEKKYLTLNISKAVYPDEKLSVAENMQLLKEDTYNACVKIYEDIYNKKLTFEKEAF